VVELHAAIKIRMGDRWRRLGYKKNL